MEMNGKPAVAPALEHNAQTLVAAVDRLRQQLAHLSGEVATTRTAVESNQGTLRIVNNEVGNLATAIGLTLDRLMPPSVDLVDPDTELGARIRAVHKQAAVLFAQLTGQTHATRSEIDRRIETLAEDYQGVIVAMIGQARQLGDESPLIGDGG